MAVPAAFAECNTVLDRPKSMTADECDPLCVCRAKDQGGYPVVISCWKLTAEELAEINRTGRLWLTLYGKTMPPAHVSGIAPCFKT